MHETSFRFARGVLGFWVASLVGFALYGYVIAELATAGMGDGVPGEAATTAIELGLAGALVLGIPAALLFGGVMRFVGRGAEWSAALAVGLVLSFLIYLPFKSFAGAIVSDWGYAREPAVFCVASALAMMAGAVAGSLTARRSRRFAPASLALAEASLDAAHAGLA